jgi:pimeloyl-ACP methyl ester carboxylesterase
VTARSAFDLELASGRLHGQRFGAADAPLVLCLPGLTANMTSFDYIGERLGGDDLQVVALDLRGRGRSEVTAPGTYGWRNHALDVFAAADALGARRFGVVGQSMGGLVAMQAAAIDAGRIDRMVLIDICGVPDPATLPLIAASASRLGQVYPSVDAYIGLVRAMGTIEPWSEYWERYLRYDLVEVEGGVRAGSALDAVLEDSRYGAEHDVYELWPSLTMPVLLLRATRELLPGAGHIVTEADRDRFQRATRDIEVVEVDANHYGINTAPASASAIREFFGMRQAGGGHGDDGHSAQ